MFGGNHHVFTPCTRDHHRWGDLCPAKIMEASSGANYDGWIRLQVTPHLAAMHLNIEHVCLTNKSLFAIWRPSWISHFTQTIYYITLQIYFRYHIICISASSVRMNYFYLQQLFFGNFLKYVCGFFQMYGSSRWILILGSCLEINNQAISPKHIHTSLER